MATLRPTCAFVSNLRTDHMKSGLFALPAVFLIDSATKNTAAQAT